MVSSRLISLPLICLLIISCNPSHSLSDIPASSPEEPEKVNLELYYETLCPSCQAFIVEDLVKLFTTDLNTIVNLRLIPFGNAHFKGSKLVCQHGEDECYLNAIHACVISTWPDQEKHFRFVRCIEDKERRSTQQHSEGVEASWKKCAKLFGGLQSIQNCYDNGYAKQLELRYGNETNSLQPPHQYVPWVTINKRPLMDNYEDFAAEVCKEYKGETLPEACKSVQAIKSGTRKKSINQACYIN